MESFMLSVDGVSTPTHTLRAPPRPHLNTFGTSPPRIARIDTVGPEAEYDPKIAYLTCVISAWSYTNADTMGRQLAYYGLPECIIREFQVVNRAMLIVATGYFVRSADGRIGVLAFRGTVPDDFMNWLTSSNTSLRNFHYGKVHTGFFQNVQPLWSEIVEALDHSLQKTDRENGVPALEPLQNLYITGHSLGAAMAVIVAARIFTNEHERFQPLIRGVYTFGQPATGDREFGEHYGKVFKLYRHVYRSDIVPHLPPRSVGEYCHFGHEFLATETGWQNTSPPSAKLAALATAASLTAGLEFVSRKLVMLRRLKLSYSLDDHGPDGYIQTSRRSMD